MDVDVAVVGAGFAGLYLVHRLRELGLSVKAFDAADDVGGTWYWNRYPGARCDIPTTDYTFSFDPQLEKEWTWSEKYATQPEILAYLGFVADRFDLRRDIVFSTRIDSAVWDDATSKWRLRTDSGEDVTCRFYVMASGCLSLPKTPDIPGAADFAGEVYFTGKWPHEPVDFSGKRVAVIGTGSSAIQSIPLIAQQAQELVVFQRTPNFSIPAHNGAPPPDRLEQLATDRDAYREAAKWSRGGVPREITMIMGATASPEVRRERFENAWQEGELFSILGIFADQGVNPVSNEIVAEMLREKIREIVDDPETAEALCPKDYPFGTKRPCLDTGYYATFNLPHVRLVDLRANPIASITQSGVDTAKESFDVDAIVFATGFDAMTGPLVAVDISGRNGVTLKEKWADGPSTYLGLTTVGFPNFFAVTGPGSPSVLSNMTVSIEQHVDWIADCISDMREAGFEVIEPTPVAESGWNQHVADCADITLYPRANSWYMGANVPGKPRVFYPYIGGVDTYRRACDEVRAQDYLGFRLTGPSSEQCNDGVVQRLQPDVQLVLETMAALELPPLESMSADNARAFMAMAQAERPQGPDVGEVVDGVLPGPDGPLAYRLYRPSTPGPHPVVVYFHGGGWVLGDLDSDDPLCRDLCDRAGAVVVSVNYRHAPEHRWPAAADDAYAAVSWVATNAVSVGGVPGQVAVAGWSAGANIAAIACQRARDLGGPEISGQLLITPVTDCDFSRPSYQENADGYVLTRGLMHWFWDHYIDPADRESPSASPLRGQLQGLPPAVIVTAEFDPLRDEGAAYADALAAAGVDVTHVRARGHTHTSLTMVDVVLSGAPVREEIGAHLRAMLPQTVPASAAT
ncbi:MAG TPA: alpha/beta hydrolase fold domain-containing protein [Mycobacteriales bacterium]|nr:alpha/beta hydrolase fold domain-containing protein [Mycobacteriales bacterium]